MCSLNILSLRTLALALASLGFQYSYLCHKGFLNHMWEPIDNLFSNLSTPLCGNKCPDSRILFRPLGRQWELSGIIPKMYSTTSPFMPSSKNIYFSPFLTLSQDWKQLSSSRIHFFKTCLQLGKILWIIEGFLTFLHWRSLCIYVESL